MTVTAFLETLHIREHAGEPSAHRSRAHRCQFFIRRRNDRAGAGVGVENGIQSLRFARRVTKKFSGGIFRRAGTAFTAPRPEVCGLQGASGTARLGDLLEQPAVVFLARGRGRIGRIIFVVARQAEFFQHERLLQNVRDDLIVLLDVFTRLARRDFKF